MRGYDLHPEVEADLEAIWEYIADNSPDAADRVIDQIEGSLAALVEGSLAALVSFPYQGHRRPS